MISAQAKEDGTFNAAVDDASNLDPAYREFQSCDGQHFFEPRRRAEFVTERPTGGQFTHEPSAAASSPRNDLVKCTRHTD